MATLIELFNAQEVLNKIAADEVAAALRVLRLYEITDSWPPPPPPDPDPPPEEAPKPVSRFDSKKTIKR